MPVVLCHHLSRDDSIQEKFEVVEPVEYVLDSKEKKSFHYIPILQSLLQILGKDNLGEKAFGKKQDQSSSAKFTSYRDGRGYKNNSFYSEDLGISLVLYVDDFEVSNPLGTSRGKHKITSIYWVLGNLPASSQSTLNSVYLALLCKAVDLEEFGYAEVLAPLLKDIAILEFEGILFPLLDQM